MSSALRPARSSAWSRFERALADVLSVLEEDSYLILAARDGSNHFVQFAAQGSNMRAEVVSNNFLDGDDVLGPRPRP